MAKGHLCDFVLNKIFKVLRVQLTICCRSTALVEEKLTNIFAEQMQTLRVEIQADSNRMNKNCFNIFMAILGLIVVLAMSIERLKESNSHENERQMTTLEYTEMLSKRVAESVIITFILSTIVIVAGLRQRALSSRSEMIHRFVYLIIVLELTVAVIVCIGDVAKLGEHKKHGNDSSGVFWINDTDDTPEDIHPNDDFHVIFNEDVTRLNLTEFVERNEIRSKSRGES